MKESKQVKLLLIRHGETLSNEKKSYLGQTDEPLSEKGKESLRQQKEKFPVINQLFVSPMIRCVESANILFPSMTSVSIPEWKEINFGVFEGKIYQELSGTKAYQDWIDSMGEMKIPEGESKEEFCNRVVAGGEKMLQMMKTLPENVYRSETIACVVHGGTIMALMSNWTKQDYYSFQIKNAEAFLCDCEVTKDIVFVKNWKKIEREK